mmetsp:Transcript_17646/g.36126  ORF Transcript_17646/g.36126 Transcript_17646/m.36126 type:complete len:130 (+) Transcript_17646:81-470(+)
MLRHCERVSSSSSSSSSSLSGSCRQREEESSSLLPAHSHSNSSGNSSPDTPQRRSPTGKHSPTGEFATADVDADDGLDSSRDDDSFVPRGVSASRPDTSPKTTNPHQNEHLRPQQQQQQQQQQRRRHQE